MGGFGDRPFGRGPFGPEQQVGDIYGDGSAAGDATASGDGASVVAQPGSAAGHATASGAGASYVDAVGAASGNATAAGIGDGLALLRGVAAGHATAAAESQYGVIATISGSATASAVGGFRLRRVKVISTDLGGRRRTLTFGPTPAFGSATQQRADNSIGVTPAITSATQNRALTTVG